MTKDEARKIARHRQTAGATEAAGLNSPTVPLTLTFFYLAQLAPRPRSIGSNFSPPNLSMNFCASAASLKQ